MKKLKNHPIYKEVLLSKNSKDVLEKISERSSKKIWWKCEQGHEWLASPVSRTKIKTGCPYCSGRLAIPGINSLDITHPSLLNYWNFEKNIIKPNEIKSGSGKKVWWRCDLGHEYCSSIKSKISANIKCPICSGRKSLLGFNSLVDKCPEIAEEWDFEKNSLNPSDVTPGSDKKVWWKCKNNHSFKSRIDHRTRFDVGCTKCNAASQTSKIEQKIINEIDKNYNVTNNLIYLNDKKYQVDICVDDSIVIEYDGYYWHKERFERDKEKSQELLDAGYSVIRIREEPLSPILLNDIFVSRFTNHRISKENFKLLMEKIYKEIENEKEVASTVCKDCSLEM